jgi:glutathionylspermidine synthase
VQLKEYEPIYIAEKMMALSGTTNSSRDKRQYQDSEYVCCFCPSPAPCLLAHTHPLHLPCVAFADKLTSSDEEEIMRKLPSRRDESTLTNPDDIDMP